MKRVFLAFIASASIASSAAAADLETVEATPDLWSGWHIGLNAGYGDSSNSVEGSSGDFFPATEISQFPSPELDTKPSGFFGGAQLGADWALGSVLVGLEGDFQLSDIDGSETQCTVLGGCADPDRYTADQSLDWFSTARVRLGLPIDRFLVYATGGIAIGEVDLSANLINNDETDAWPASSSKIEFGWTAGAGASWLFSDKASIGLEYLYVDLGDRTLSVEGTGPAVEFVNYEFENKFHIAKISLNFHF